MAPLFTLLLWQIVTTLVTVAALRNPDVSQGDKDIITMGWWLSLFVVGVTGVILYME